MAFRHPLTYRPATDARDWCESVTSQSVAMGQRIAAVFSDLGMEATYETQLPSPHRNARTDILVIRPESQQSKV